MTKPISFPTKVLIIKKLETMIDLSEPGYWSWNEGTTASIEQVGKEFDVSDATVSKIINEMWPDRKNRWNKTQRAAKAAFTRSHLTKVDRIEDLEKRIQFIEDYLTSKNPRFMELETKACSK